MSFIRNRALTLNIVSLVLFFGFVHISFAAQPVIEGVTTIPGSYPTGFCANWTFQLDQYIDVVGGEAGPSIDVQIGDRIVAATLSSYSGPGAEFSIVNFSYCAEETDVSSTGVEVFSPIKLNGSTIKSDPGGEDLILTFTPPDSSGVLLNPDHPEITTRSPLDNANSISAAPSLALIFDEVVNVENGDITIYRVDNDATVSTIDVTSADISGGGTDTILTTPLKGLLPGTEYYVLIDDTAFDDAEGNSYAGISSTASWTFTTADFSQDNDRISFDSNAPAIDEGSTQDISVTLGEPIIAPGGLAEVEITITSSDTDRLTVSPSVITFTEDEWHHTKTITITAVDESIYHSNDDNLVYLSYSVVSDSELYTGFARILPVTISDNDEPIPQGKKSSRISYTCKDETSTNYNPFGRHKESLCEYGTGLSAVVATTTPVVTGAICPLDQQLTQNLKAPSHNGSINSYTGGIVQEADKLQGHLNRLGFNSGPEDGILGPISEGAIKRMQTFLGTPADGYVGPLTRELINKSCGSDGLQTS